MRDNMFLLKVLYNIIDQRGQGDTKHDNTRNQNQNRKERTRTC